MTLSFGGGAGVLTIPGFTSDGQTPGGIVVAGGAAIGDASATASPTASEIYGQLTVLDSVGTNAVGDDLMDVVQVAALADDANGSTLLVARSSSLNGHQYLAPLLRVNDLTTTTADLQQWQHANTPVAAIGKAGGLGLFGKAAPTAPRTLAQATITAITDANAKAAVQACANALADMGVLTLT